MRTIIILCLALLIALSFGCSKKKEEAPKTEAVQEDVSPTLKVSPTVDVVSKEEIDFTTAAYSYELDNVIYYFTSAENMEMFKADPAKYLTPSPAPETAPQNQ